MRAAVEDRVEVLAILVADHDHRAQAHANREERVGFRKLGFVGQVHPRLAAEDLHQFFVEDRGVGVELSVNAIGLDEIRPSAAGR